MLVAQGLTHTGSAIQRLDMIEARKSNIAITGYHIIARGCFITDGERESQMLL